MLDRRLRPRLCVAETLLAFVLLGAGAASAGAEVGPEFDSTFDYLYLEGNEDRASGGHAAIRIDDDVFHFQYEDGLLRMERDPWSDFQLSYRGFQNRSVHRTRVAVSGQTLRQLKAAFARQHLTQSDQIGRLHAAQADQPLVEVLTGNTPETLVLPGLGFFVAPGAASEPARAAALPRLRQSIGARYGARFLDSAQRREEARLLDLEVRVLEARASDFVAGALPRPRYPFHERYADTQAAIRSLETLRSAAPLAGTVLVAAGNAAARKRTPAARHALTHAARELEARLVTLVRGTRPDWGSAMLLGMARLESIEASLANGRWELLDARASDATSFELGPRARTLLPRFEAEAEREWRAAREAWHAVEGWDERAFARLESSAARWSALRAAVAGAAWLRIQHRPGVPRGLGPLHEPRRPRALASHGESLRSATAASAREIEHHAREALGYRLVTRNCVSELFATVERALAEGLGEGGETFTEEVFQAELAAHLGGVVDASPIPFVSSIQVRRNWRVVSTDVLLSLRRELAAELYAADPSLWVRLRESNTWTSTLYDASDRDSYFVFFTDASAPLRPLLGAVNLLAGFGKAGVGLVRLPFDGGRDLSAGLRGALFSLPELAFFNIRKGTNDWVPAALRPGGSAGRRE